MNVPREEALFTLALTKAAAERASFLDRECGTDTGLRRRIETRLASFDRPGPGVTTQSSTTRHAGDLAAEDAGDPIIGQSIGRYKLREKLGEGGCGAVYVAEQTEPVRRRVALKLIKLGMDTREVIARFEAERQALAMMDHPNIARVLDADTTAAGRPYFVMELVRGVHITEYCDKASLSTQERLGLFVQVCQAIQHAHQKGIIHRDIKPSNILVTMLDGVPVPKVIDFGIAKATEGRLTDATVYTHLHQFIGTPAYMSPEQAEMSGLDIDTRSDVYSLGVLLYQLLTGSTPFDAKELVSLGLDAMRRAIREQEPKRPSTRLEELKGDALTTTAKRRSVDAPDLIHLLKGDLDKIVMKALEKDRTRRYDTANGFARDIQRYLANEPVSATEPSMAYRMGKFVRRHRGGLSIAAAMALLVLALLASVLQLFQEKRAGKLGAVRINSEPEGAEVWSDGRKLGNTPLELAGLPLGSFTYRLVLGNHDLATNTTTLAARKQNNDFTFLRKVAPGPGDSPNLATNLLASQAFTVLGIQGNVEIARRDSGEWTPAQTNMVVLFGDRLRTGVNSRATLRLPDDSVVRINQLSVISINMPGNTTNDSEKPMLRAKDGPTYQIKTPVATGVIRG